MLDGGAGVCQDFAHVLISLCRHVGLPARYVSGYLGGVPQAAASHAWMEAYVPPYGWLGIDATLGTHCTGQHVKIGVGRDYADVAVLRGTYQGGSEAELDVSVTSEVVGATDRISHVREMGEEPGRRLVAIQNLGEMRRFQQGAVLTQAMGGLRQSIGDDMPLPPPRAQRRADDGTPSQQPHQQQQGARPMRIDVGCRFEYTAAGRGAGGDTRGAALLARRSGARVELRRRTGSLRGSLRQRCRRLDLPDGRSTFSFHASIEDSGEPEDVPGADATQHRIEQLPSEQLHWLLPSRFCESDLLTDRAWELFGSTPRGADRVQAVCDWIHEHVTYGVPSLPTTTALDTLEQSGGMCRDFAHVGVSFCRALGIPARYVFGYLPDIGIPGPYPDDGLPRLVRGLARRALVDVRRALQRAAHRSCRRSVAGGTRPTSRW